MIGISEGIVLADRYRLVRRQTERGIGATWVAADTETGSDVWVQFADHGGLGDAARFLREHEHPAIPAVLDTGELRMVVDSRAVAVAQGREAPHATHVEIVIEFAVLRPVTGRSLPAKIARRALAPTEALLIVAALAEALELAGTGGLSHGWITADSVWLVRRGGCAVDLALGLAFPDGSRIEVEQAVTGYFAPERLGGEKKAGGGASEAADVFALGWMLYEALIGHAALQAEYARLVAAAGAVTTVELLALWRERARQHIGELVETGSALAPLLIACLAENAADRPGLGAFGSGAREAAGRMAGIGPLVQFAARAARHAATRGEVAADEAAALVVGAALGMTAAELGAQEGEIGELAAHEGGAAQSGAVTAEAEAREAGGAGESGAGTELAAQAASGAFAQTASASAAVSGTESEERAGRRHRILIGAAVASALATFAVGLAVGYQWGHGGGPPNSRTQAAGGAVPAASPSGAAIAAGAGTGTSSSAAAAVSTAASPSPSASSPETAAAPVIPTSNASALAQLAQTVSAARASGAITASEAAALSEAIGRIQATPSGSGEWTSALRNLGNLIQNGREQGTIPVLTANQLASSLSYLYTPVGS